MQNLTTTATPDSEASTLSPNFPDAVDQYFIEFSDKGTVIYTLGDAAGTKEWVATVADPELAMRIVEGLILVQYKRLEHPDSEPVLRGEGGQTRPLPPFLTKKKT